MGLEETLSSAVSSITSPAKIAFVGYVILAYIGKISTSRWEFIVVALFFFVFQVLHDDYARIWLNGRAELHVEKARRQAFGGS